MKVLCIALAIALPAVAACARDVVHESDEDDGELMRLAFDPATVQELHGRIVEVDVDQRIAGSKRGVRVLLETTDEQLYVYIAPQGYFDQVTLELHPGQSIAVRGSVLAGDGHRVVIAQSISVGTATYALRDADGRPKWREWRSSREW